jgi:hypothetical protein
VVAKPAFRNGLQKGYVLSCRLLSMWAAFEPSTFAAIGLVAAPRPRSASLSAGFTSSNLYLLSVMVRRPSLHAFLIREAQPHPCLGTRLPPDRKKEAASIADSTLPKRLYAIALTMLAPHSFSLRCWLGRLYPSAFSSFRLGGERHEGFIL